MIPYRLIALFIVSVTAFIVLTVALPSIADSLPLNDKMQIGDASFIYLPIVVQGGVPNPGSDQTEVVDQADQDTISSNWWAIPHQYLILWQEPNSIQAAAQQNASQGQNLWLNYDILDLSKLVDAGLEGRAEAILESYRNDPAVALVEANYVYTSTLIPGDPRQDEQYAWDLINGYEAWDVTMGDSSITIAVVDSGVDLDHPDLVDKIVDGFDFVDGDTVADDGNGHGTHVAGTAAASTDNAQDGAGACPNCSIMPIRALGNNGRGNLANIAAAVTFAANNGAHVINLSLGAPARSFVLERAVNQAAARGAFVVCAAGNNGSDEAFFPAGFDNCFSVASVTETDQRSDFSNFGSSVDVAAPGSAILSTVPGNRMDRLNGTSMAAPHVAGLAGLLFSLGLTNNDIRDNLCNTADEITGTGEFWQCGRINMRSAVEDVAQAPTPTPTFTLTSSPTPLPTASPTPLPTSSPNDPLDDGGFEKSYYQGWTYSDASIRSAERAASGGYSARLGGENDSADFVEQEVVIPANGRLSYSWLAESADTIDFNDNLVLELELSDNSDAKFILRHLPQPQSWQRSEVDVSEFAGESVIVRFRADTNADVPMIFYVDDVVLAAIG